MEMERKICRDVVCTSRKDEEGKDTSVSDLKFHSYEEVLVVTSKLILCVSVRVSSGLVRAASVPVTTSWRFSQQEYEILPKGECRNNAKYIYAHTLCAYSRKQV